MSQWFLALVASVIAFSVSIPAEGSEPITQGVSSDTDAKRMAVEQTIRQFFAAYVAKDVEAAMSTWSEDSPDRAERRETLVKLFAGVQKIDLKGLEFRRTQIERGLATVRVIVDLSGLDRETGEPSVHFQTMDRVFELAETANGFRIVRYLPTSSDARLGTRIAEVRNADELNRLLRAELEFEADRSEAIQSAFINAATPDQRQRLLQIDLEGPFGALANTQFVVHLNRYSWAELFAGDDSATLRLAERFNLLAFDVAEFLDDVESIAWCGLHRAILLANAKAQDDEAFNFTRRALADFESLGYTDGQAAAQLVLGRLAVAVGDQEAAMTAFHAAEQLFSRIVIFAKVDDQTLGETWALLQGEIERLHLAFDEAQRAAAWEQAATHIQQALAEQQDIYGPWHPSVVTDWRRLAVNAWCRGDLPAAIAAYKTAVSIAEKLYADQSLEMRHFRFLVARAEDLLALDPEKRDQFVSSCRTSVLAEARANESKFAESLALWDESIEQRTAVMGGTHYLVGEAWLGRAKTCLAANSTDIALSNFREASKIFAESEQANAPDYRDAVSQVANLQFDQSLTTMDDSDLRASITSCERVIEIFVPVTGHDGEESITARNYLQAARSLLGKPIENRRGISLRISQALDVIAGGLTGKAQEIDVLQQSLDAIRPVFGDDSEFAIRIRLYLALAYQSAGMLDLALEQLREGQQFLNGLPKHPRFAELHVVLAEVYFQRNELRHAKGALQIAFDALIQSSRFQLAPYGRALKLKASLNRQLGDLMTAEGACLRLLLIQKRQLLPVAHPDYFGPTIPVDLDAELLKDRVAVAVDFITVLNQLGAIQYLAGRKEDARNTYRKALHFAEKLDEKDRDRGGVYFAALCSVGSLCSEFQEWDDAQDYLRRALDFLVAHPRVNTEDICLTTFNLAYTFHAQRQFEAAMILYRTGAELLSQQSSQFMQTYWFVWRNLAMCQAAQNDRQGAVESLETCLRSLQKRLDEVFSFRSEGQSQQVWSELLEMEHCLVALALAPEATPAEVLTAWNWSLRVKGRLLDSLIRYRQAQTELKHNPKVSQLAEQAVQWRNQIAELALNPPAELSPTALQARIARFQGALDTVLGELNDSAGLVSEEQESVSLQALRQNLPTDAALIEFARMPRCNWQQFGEDFWSPDRYVAFILPPGAGAEPTIIDIGDAESIDEKIETVRELIVTTSDQLQISSERAAEEDFQERSQELYDSVFAPLRPHLGDAGTVCVIPDGELHRIAFEALVDRPGHYLIEDYQFAYLTSAGDLLRPARKSGAGVWVFAGPDFDLSVEKRTDLVAAKDRGEVDLITEPDEDAIEVNRGGSWKRLDHAAEELQVVQQALDGSRYGQIHPFSGPHALEDVLKTLRSPRVLHLATHGFFVEDLRWDEGRGSRGGSGASLGLGRLRQQKNPFLRSGLVLAGANRLGTAAGSGATHIEDGWVTAEEIASLDLQGTELVVLSACETGLGDVKTGGGVQGLRQAFLYAGARTLVTSLYRVPDDATRELMQQFYEGLKGNQGKLRSLRDAQLRLLEARRKKDGAAHPYFWGSFILVGNPQ